MRPATDWRAASKGQKQGRQRERRREQHPPHWEARGFRPLQVAIGVVVGLVGLSYIAQLVVTPVDRGPVLQHSVAPDIANSGASPSLPAACERPSLLTRSCMAPRRRTDQASIRGERNGLLRYARIKVLIALGGAGLVNLAMVVMAASDFHMGRRDVAQIDTAYDTLTPLLGSESADLFLAAPIASGISSSVVGTIAG